MIVRFTTTCDHCGRRAPEYDSWAQCYACERDVCDACDIPEKRIEPDLNQPYVSLCRGCVDTREYIDVEDEAS